MHCQPAHYPQPKYCGADQGSLQGSPIFKNKMKHSDITSIAEGLNISAMIKVWREVTACELRLVMMKELRTLNLGFSKVEEFNLGLSYHLKSQKMKDAAMEPNLKLIRTAMEIKMNDERCYNKELCSERNKMRQTISKKLGNNSKPYRRIIMFLRHEASKERETHETKYKEKILHLKKKYREEEDSKLNKIPPGLEQYASLSIFNQERFNNI